MSGDVSLNGRQGFHGWNCTRRRSMGVCHYVRLTASEGWCCIIVRSSVCVHSGFEHWLGGEVSLDGHRGFHGWGCMLCRIGYDCVGGLVALLICIGSLLSLPVPFVGYNL